MALRYHKLWHFLGALQVLLVVYLMLTRITVEVEVISHVDKIAHWTVFSVLMSWYAQLMHSRWSRVFSTACIVILGIGLEYLQALSPYRHFDYADMLANMVGIISGIILMRISGLRYLYWLELKLSKKKADA